MNDHRVTYKVQRGPSHSSISIWVNGGLAGKITVRKDEESVLQSMELHLRANGANYVYRGEEP